MFCPKCGKEIPEDTVFCFKCGANLKESLGDIKTVAGTDEEVSISDTLSSNNTQLADTISGGATVGGVELAASTGGRYEILGTLGQGGMGEVYKAKDNRLGRTVAIKRLLPSFSSNEKAFSRFIFEAKSLASLNHPNIVNIYDFDEDNEGHFITMEYVEGGSLAELLKNRGKLETDEALNLFVYICNGLAQAHEKGIIHRDIKPANILIGTNGIPKLTDFGIAQIVDSGDMTKTGVAMGTMKYMAPEQEKDAGSVDARADIYSLGVTLYEMLTGEIPKIINLDRVAETLRPILNKMLAIVVDERPAGIAELLDDLQNVKGISFPRRSEVGCLSCGFENPIDVKFCQKCGSDLSSLFHKCSMCGNENRKDVKHCGKCGNDIGKEIEEFEVEKGKAIAELDAELADNRVKYESEMKTINTEISALEKDLEELSELTNLKKDEHDKLKAELYSISDEREKLEKKLSENKMVTPLIFGKAKYKQEMEVIKKSIKAVNNKYEEVESQYKKLSRIFDVYENKYTQIELQKKKLIKKEELYDAVSRNIYKGIEDLRLGIVRTDKRLYPVDIFDEEEEETKYGYINNRGDIVIEPQFADARDFSEGFAAIRDRTSGKWGFIDISGQIVIKPQFEDVGDFSENLAGFKNNKKLWGFLNTTGAIVIIPQYRRISKYSEGLSLVEEDIAQWNFVDHAGNRISSNCFVHAQSFSDGLAWILPPDFKERKNVCYMDKGGNVALELIGKKAGAFSEGRTYFIDEGTKKWGYIDTSGVVVIEAKFDLTTNYSEGLAGVMIDQKMGYIDISGSLVIKPQFEKCDAFSEGVAKVQEVSGGQWGYISRNGEWLIEPQFSEAESFLGGLAKVNSGDYINKTGLYVWKSQDNK